MPLGAWARREGEGLRLQALVAREDGSELLRAEGQGADPAELGRRVADELLARGAGALLGR